jgi:HK97 family phage major capsid protein
MTVADPVLAGLESEKDKVETKANNILANSKATTAELLEAKKLLDRRDEIDADITVRKDVLYQAEPTPNPMHKGGNPENKSGRMRIDTGKSEIEKLEADGGFKGIGHFAYDMYKAGRHGQGEVSDTMKRWKSMQLNRKSPSGMFEQSDPDGGDLIPRDFSNQVYRRMVTMNQILSKLNPLPIKGNAIDIPALKEDSRVDGQRWGGITGFWDGEANQYTATKSRVRLISLKLHKLTVFTFVTDELMADSDVALQSFLLQYAPLEINFKINDAIVNGTGNGMPLGVLNSNSLITVPAVAGQGNNTIVYQNIQSMYSRVVAGQRGSMVWMYNQDAEAQLSTMFMPTGTAAGVAIFTPNTEGTGFNLKGRPALVMEQCQSIGTAGDIIAFAPDGYVCATKGGIESFMSMHLRFDFDEMAFKWRFRFDGQPYDNVPLTPFKGTTTVSSMLVLNSTRT